MTIDEQKFRQILVEELDARLEAKLEEKLENKLNTKFAEAFGQMTRYFDKRFDKLEKKLNKRIDGLYAMFDIEGRRLENEEFNQAAINARLDRHNRWIGELSQNTGIKLSPP